MGRYQVGDRRAATAPDGAAPQDPRAPGARRPGSPSLGTRGGWGLGLLLAACLFATPATAQVRFDFETGDLQGWQVVEGRFDRLVCDRAFFHNEPQRPYNKQGRYFLSTLERADNTPSDAFTGRIESPVFVLEAGPIAFRVGGGAHPNTYVALCDAQGEELLRASGANTEVMQTITWDATPFAGRRCFLRLVDQHQGGWGHVTFDDFTAAGALDAAATRARDARREREVRAAQAHALRAEITPLREAIRDLTRTFGKRYPRGHEFLRRLDALEQRVGAATLTGANQPARTLDEYRSAFDALKREALIANPLVSGQPILYVVRPQYAPDHHSTETLFQTGEINTASFRGGSALKSIHFGRGGETKTLVSAPEGIVRDPDVHFDGKRVLFSLRRDRNDDAHLYEVNVDGTGLRQLTTGAGISDIDPIYLPDGDILFSSTREPKVCQCNRHVQANLFRMDAAGRHLRQLGRNTLFEGHPALMPDGRILYDRWEYVDKHFGPAFGLWTMNPDGTNHAVFYGNNAWSPGAILDGRIVPGTRRFIATFGSCHDRPWGALALVDPALGLDGIHPVVRSWPPDIRRFLKGNIDTFMEVSPKYEDPYPLSDRYFLCSRQVEGERMGLFLLDTFGNELLLHIEGPGCYDPMPIAPRPRPPVIPPRVKPTSDEGFFYVADVYQGQGMERVPRGTIKTLRIVEAPVKLFWSNGNWNIDATQAPAMNWNSTNNKRILGDVPVEADGSAYFAVPAGKFVYFQLLDANRMMVQSMRSGTTIQPGETTGCIGCHEERRTTVPNHRLGTAFRRAPSRIQPWYGPPREFNYLTEVQPVFDRHCVSCHDYGKPAGEVLNLAGDLGLAFNTSYLELRRKSAVRWFPDEPGAPKLLVKAVDDGPPEVLPAYSWGSHRSRLVDIIRSEHYGVRLDRESIDRIVTWIDLNAPYYGSYATATPDHAFGRSPLNGAQLARLAELTGVKVGEQATEMQGSPVSFTRPELSPCLAGLKERNAAAYAEALAIIRAGQAFLAHTPRADMPGARLIGQDLERQHKHAAYTAAEVQARKALAESHH
ncbi:MAG: hypothetical protein GX774_06530 [Armatimonadetes bacterium]|nr:hypothetical protein [Armatimonadota bacterium]